MAMTNHERVGKALDLLKSGLGPFIERELTSVYKDRALAEARRLLPASVSVSVPDANSNVASTGRRERFARGSYQCNRPAIMR